jgi:thiamine transporter
MKNSDDLKKITFSSIFVALAIVLEIITDYVPGLNLQMPLGGNIFGISMLPIILIGIICGWYYGILGGLIFGVVNWLISGHDITPWSWALDYMLPGVVLGISGFVKDAKKKPLNYIIAILIPCFARYIILSLSGVTIWAVYAPGDKNLFFYSFILYNGPYMLTSTVLCLAIGILIRKSILRISSSVLALSSND